MLTDYMSQQKKEEEDLPALKTMLTHQYHDLKIIKKSAEKVWLQPTETILTTRGPTERNNKKTKMEENQLYGRFKQLKSNISHKKIWMWLRNGNFKRETEFLIITTP